jgi:hypothetical protein
MPVVLDYGVADRNALVTDVGTGIIARRRDELANDILAFMAERTAEGIIRSGALQTGSPTEREINRSLALIKYVCVTSITSVMDLNTNKTRCISLHP